MGRLLALGLPRRSPSGLGISGRLRLLRRGLFPRLGPLLCAGGQTFGGATRRVLGARPLHLPGAVGEGLGHCLLQMALVLEVPVFRKGGVGPVVGRLRCLEEATAVP